MKRLVNETPEVKRRCPFCGGVGEICCMRWDFEENKPMINNNLMIATEH